MKSPCGVGLADLPTVTGVAMRTSLPSTTYKRCAPVLIFTFTAEGFFGVLSGGSNLKECEWEAVRVVSHPVRLRIAVAATAVSKKWRVDFFMEFPLYETAKRAAVKLMPAFFEGLSGGLRPDAKG